MLRTAITVIATLAVLGLGGLGFLYSGVYDVSAVDPHWPPVRWAILVNKRNSIERRASDIVVPALDAEERVSEGARLYAEACTSCHDSPTRVRPLGALRMTPSPPSMDEPAAKLKPAELFWVVKNGIKMTGMPSWGPAMSDDRIWAIVAFIEKMPSMTAERYRSLLRSGQPADPVAAGDGSPAAVPDAIVTIRSADIFSPRDLTVPVGGLVQWTNASEKPCAVTVHPQAASDPRRVLIPEDAAAIRSGTLKPGERYRHRFSAAGRYVFLVTSEGGHSARVGIVTAAVPSSVKPLSAELPDSVPVNRQAPPAVSPPRGSGPRGSL